MIGDPIGREQAGAGGRELGEDLRSGKFEERFEGRSVASPQHDGSYLPHGSKQRTVQDTCFLESDRENVFPRIAADITSLHLKHMGLYYMWDYITSSSISVVAWTRHHQHHHGRYIEAIRPNKRF